MNKILRISPAMFLLLSGFCCMPSFAEDTGPTLITNVDWHHAEVNPGNVPGKYKLRATSKDNTNFYDEVTFVVVGMQFPLQYKIGTNSWTDMPDPLYVYKDTSVDFKAVKIPSDVNWSSGKPIWGGLVS